MPVPKGTALHKNIRYKGTLFPKKNRYNTVIISYFRGHINKKAATRMEDREIVEGIRKDGKTQLFALVVKKYEGAVFAKSLAITKQQETAREVAQQTFIRAYQRLIDWRGKELGPWLTAIACHLSLNELEKMKRQRGADLSQVQMATEEYTAEHETQLLRMEQAIAQLPADDQQLLRLYYYKKVKTEELARQLGLSQSNVLVRLHRIRERLKKLMQYGTH